MRSNELEVRAILAPMPGPWGKAIEALRLAKRPIPTRETIAKRAKMTPTTYGRIEKGQHTQTSKLQDIADVFGVPIEQVLQIPSLPNSATPGNTALSTSTAQADHGQHRPIPAVESAAIHELQTQVRLLQDQLARLAAERGVQRVRAGKTRKPVRSRHARKSR